MPSPKKVLLLQHSQSFCLSVVVGSLENFQVSLNIIISVWLAGWLWTFLGGYPSEVYQTLRYQIEYDNLHLAFSVHNSFDDHDSLPHHVKTVTEKKLVISW